MSKRGLQIFGAVMLVVNIVVYTIYPNGWSFVSGLLAGFIILTNRS